jgi:hypothetical protein
MPPKFAKKDRVRVLATRFDKDNVEDGEQTFSEKWAAEDDSDSSEDDRVERKDNMLDEERSEDVSTDYEGETLRETTERDGELTDDEAGEVEERDNHKRR